MQLGTAERSMLFFVVETAFRCFFKTKKGYIYIYICIIIYIYTFFYLPYISIYFFFIWIYTHPEIQDTDIPKIHNFFRCLFPKNHGFGKMYLRLPPRGLWPSEAAAVARAASGCTSLMQERARFFRGIFSWKFWEICIPKPHFPYRMGGFVKCLYKPHIL